MRKNISFILRPPSGSDLPTYEFTKSSKDNNADTLDRGSNRQYIAEEAAKPDSSTNVCKGYWKAIADSDGSGHDNGGSFDGDDF